MKDGIRSRTTGVVMHGSGLKKKYRCYPDDSHMKNKPTKTKK